jgi:two-component system OmpR family sensor kinase
MFKTLYGRLALALVLLFLAIGISYGLITSITTERHLQEITQHFNRDLAKRIVADRNLVAEGRLDESALKETFSIYMDINPSIEIYLLDIDGRILSFSADPGKVKRQYVDVEPIKAFLNGEGFPLLGDDPRSHDRMKAFSVTPVPSSSRPEGYLYVVLRGEQYDSAQQAVQDSYLVRLSGWALVGSLGFGLLAGLLLFHLLTRRLQKLTQQIERFQQSDFQQHEAFNSARGGEGDEIERLWAVFESMAERISSQLNQLRKQDSLRRELVAQVSHDLRTPLASIQGYLETLQMKAEQLSESQRREHLDIVLRQSRRLSHMVDELFELAQLEARETVPRFESFMAAELISDVQQKFQLRARDLGVRLEMSPPGDSGFVRADISLTERVLDNLISNALDHTPQGGHVELGIEAADGALISVYVSNSGSGIDVKDLGRIFEPFYRAGDATGKKLHAGLGLAISKKIVELQGGNIRADNLPGGGVKFSFELPVISGK